MLRSVNSYNQGSEQFIISLSELKTLNVLSMFSFRINILNLYMII